MKLTVFDSHRIIAAGTVAEIAAAMQARPLGRGIDP